MLSKKPENFAEYKADFPEEVQTLLEKIRETIKKAAPEAEEIISYAIPAFRIHGANLVYFAAFKKNIGFYALPSGNASFKKELLAYKVGKGSIQFPLDKPMPLELIAKMVKFRIQEILDKKAKKEKAKS